jgi:hypothetical protein
MNESKQVFCNMMDQLVKVSGVGETVDVGLHGFDPDLIYLSGIPQHLRLARRRTCRWWSILIFYMWSDPLHVGSGRS